MLSVAPRDRQHYRQCTRRIAEDEAAFLVPADDAGVGIEPGEPEGFPYRGIVQNRVGGVGHGRTRGACCG
jgi:hypothetical protein